MKRSMQWVSIALVALCLFGCKSEDPNPELLDPIYKDLLSRTDEATKSLEEHTVRRKELELFLETAEPNTIDLKKARLELIKVRNWQRRAEQQASYFRIRAERRKIEDRRNYKIAFQNNQPWPDKAEYSGYLVNKRLHEVNLNWNARVPKLADRTSSSVSKTKKEEKTAH
jgi:hypothetical protein